MGMEITRRKNGSLRSKWWYGNFTVDGKRHYINLGIEIEGNIPESLKELGDMPFERSRMKAHLKLDVTPLATALRNQSGRRCPAGRTQRYRKGLD